MFIFALLFGAEKDFIKDIKAFIKPFEAPQRNVKIKIELIFISVQISEINGTWRVKAMQIWYLLKEIHVPRLSPSNKFRYLPLGHAIGFDVPWGQ